MEVRIIRFTTDSSKFLPTIYTTWYRLTWYVMNELTYIFDNLVSIWYLSRHEEK